MLSHPLAGGNPAQVDLREQIVNEGRTGPIQEVSVPKAMITSIRAVMLDIDPGWLRPELLPSGDISDPQALYENLVRHWLERHPVLARAEVRCSGRGLHVLLRLAEPVDIPSEAERQRWAARVRAIQRLLPTDPHAPGITAMTRPVGSVNGKNSAEVYQLCAGEPIPAEDLVALVEEIAARPFATVSRVLLGGERARPCPCCQTADSTLEALDKKGRCYTRCGDVSLSGLYGLFVARPAEGGK